MTDILIRGVDPKAVRRLKERAKRNGRSLASEARLALERAAGPDKKEFLAVLDKWRAEFAGKKLISSVDLIREDRER